MAIIDSEGFGFSTTAGDYVTYGLFNTISGASIQTGGVLGDNYCDASNSSAVVFRLFPSTIASGILGCRMMINNTVFGGGFNRLFIASSVGTGQFYLQFNTVSQIIQIYNADNTLLGSTSGITFINSAWFYLEVKFVIGTGTAGSVQVHVNGSQVITVTGVNTANDSVNVNAAGAIWQGGQFDNFKMMHFYLCDETGSAPWNTFLGDVRVQTLLPISNASVAFTPNGLVSNWQNVAQVPPVPGSDYNSDSTVGDQDTFNCSSIATSAVSVYGLHVKSVLAKSDSGLRFAQTVLTSGATTVTGTSTALSTSPAQVRTIYEVDPHTSAQWTTSAVNTIQAGYEVSS